MRLIWALSVAAVAQAKLAVKNAKVDVLSSLGTTSSSIAVSETSPVSDIKLGDTETLRIGFQVEDGGSGTRPDQSAILWEKADKTASFVQSVKVRNTGHGKYELDPKRLPTGLAKLASPVYATLLVSAPSAAIKIPLGLVDHSGAVSPASSPVVLPEWEAEKYAYQPDQLWPADAPRKTPASFIWASASALVAAPFLVWALSISKLGVSIAPSSKTTAFWATLVAFEILNLVYWAGVRLTVALPFYAGGLFIILVVGKNTL